MGTDPLLFQVCSPFISLYLEQVCDLHCEMNLLCFCSLAQLSYSPYWEHIHLKLKLCKHKVKKQTLIQLFVQSDLLDFTLVTGS